jgi:quercetin dioxygenase-like cupin family protein
MYLKKWLNPAAAALLLVCSVTYARTEPVDVLVSYPPDEPKWVGLPFAPGVKAAWLTGAVDKAELYTLRVHLDKGAKVPPHTHPDTRMITVLSGELSFGHGAHFTEDDAKIYGPGSFFVVPAGLPHFVFAKNGEAVYQEAGLGPSPTLLIKP